jgi:hypothetical protein
MEENSMAALHAPTKLAQGLLRLRTWLVLIVPTVALALVSSAHRIGFPAIAATAPQQPVSAAEPLSAPPQGYREWELISVAILGPPFNDIRAKLGNHLAIGTLRSQKFPFPNGAMIARLAWRQVQSDVNNNAFRADPSAEHLNAAGLQKLLASSFAAGPATNVQFMIKDSKKYASTGGWGFFQFTNGKPDHIVQAGCFACHASGSSTDFVFTRYSP